MVYTGQGRSKLSSTLDGVTRAAFRCSVCKEKFQRSDQLKYHRCDNHPELVEPSLRAILMKMRNDWSTCKRLYIKINAQNIKSGCVVVVCYGCKSFFGANNERDYKNGITDACSTADYCPVFWAHCCDLRLCHTGSSDTLSPSFSVAIVWLVLVAPQGDKLSRVLNRILLF